MIFSFLVEAVLFYLKSFIRIEVFSYEEDSSNYEQLPRMSLVPQGKILN